MVASLLLHLGVFSALYYLPQPRSEPPKDPIFIDLQQIQKPKTETIPEQQTTKRQSEQRIRVPRETAPRGYADSDSQRKAVPIQPSQPSQPRATAPTAPSQPQPSGQSQPQIAPGSSAAGLLKPKSLSANPSPQFFPTSGRMAQLEESYRRKFEHDITEGDTRFLNSDDVLFGSFLRRFENAVYGVWRYPQEAAVKGISGIVPVRITFNRRGEIARVQQLESSGAWILDEEVLRTLRAIGPVGGFPKGYDKEEFHLIAFFQYGGARRSLR